MAKRLLTTPTALCGGFSRFPLEIPDGHHERLRKPQTTCPSFYRFGISSPLWFKRMYILPQALTPTDSRPQATKFGCLSKLRRAPPHLVWFAQLSPKILHNQGLMVETPYLSYLVGAFPLLLHDSGFPRDEQTNQMDT